MESRKKTARWAGFMYLIMAVSGPVGIIIVPSQIVVEGNATATVANILSHELFFRFGIISNLICQVSFIFLVLALYKLFRGGNEWHSRLMLSLVIAAVPIAFLAELTQVAALLILNGSDYLNTFNTDQLNSLALFFLQLHEKAIVIAGIFWGLWLYPFGYLTIKSGFIPKILGILLMIGCFSYLIDSSIALLFPSLQKASSGLLMIPLGIGEISMVLWLLIKGVKNVDPRKVKN